MLVLNEIILFKYTAQFFRLYSRDFYGYRGGKGRICERLTHIYDNTGAALGRNWGASASFGYKLNHTEKSEIEL